MTRAVRARATSCGKQVGFLVVDSRPSILDALKLMKKTESSGYPVEKEQPKFHNLWECAIYFKAKSEHLEGEVRRLKRR